VPVSLQGEAEREVVRVPVECCLQEAGWNPYYALLLGRLAAAGTGHAVTLQYCLWDHFRVGAVPPPPPCSLTACHAGRAYACLTGGCLAASAAACR
jgi:MA3 domain